MIALALTCAACSQQDAPAEDIAEAAEAIVDPAPAAPPLAKGRYAPRNECVDIEGAEAFRGQLIAAVKARDADALVALAASDIELDFGGSTGTALLRQLLDEPAGGMWQELAQLMTLGCAENEQGGVTIPWYFEQDLGIADPASAMLVTGEDVRVRERADPASRSLRTISWEVVESAGFEPENALQPVKLADGMVGYVATGNLRSLLDFRLSASSRNGQWSITSLVAGD